MDVSHLSTRVRIPPPPHLLVSRPRLTALLKREVPARRLVAVTAPAGYGKTTLLADWARTSEHPVAWLTVEPDDNDPERFVRHLARAWETAQPGIADRTPGILLEGAMPDVDEVLSALASGATATEGHLAIVVDDYQWIEIPDVHETVTFLLDHLPETLHIVVGSREVPPLPLSRYRARQQLLDIGAADLRLTPEEAGAFLNGQLGLELPEPTVSTLTAQVEGWFAGLQLASLTIQHGGDAPTISGRHRFIADFLRDEVLSRLDDNVRTFLIQTSLVDRLCGSLCDAITRRDDGQRTLERLERDNLFTIPLDDARDWYRYHALMRDFLHQEVERMPGDEVARLHVRVADWYLLHHMPEPAFHHASQSGDIDTVTRVIDAFALAMLYSGQVRTLAEWLHAMPRAWFRQEPLLGIFRSGVLFFMGQFEAAAQCIDEVDATLRSRDVPHPSAQARATAVRCFVACSANNVAQAESFAEIALQTLTPADESYRAGVLGALGDVYRRNGRWDASERYYRLALDHIDDPEGYIESVSMYGALADLELRKGRLHAAADYWRRALAVIHDDRLWGVYPLPLIGWVHIRLGETLYEWNELEEARDLVARGRERAELGGDPRSIIAGGSLDARLHLARGDVAAADALIEHIRPVVAEAQFLEWTAVFERQQAELWLAQGKLRTAVSWMDAARTRSEFGQPDTEPASLAVARVLMVEGDAASISQAISLLDGLASDAQEQGRIGLEIDALALRAIGLWARGDRIDALTAIDRALRLAEPEGYVRLFVDLGLPMARLLQEAASRKVMTDYVRRLLGAFNAGVLAHLPAGSQLPEPLSEREVEVLHLIAAGLTNREIGDSLYISPETVKKHTVSIYGKLGVHGRTEAVSRARSIDLLD